MTDREKALADALQNIVKFYKPFDHDKVSVEQHNNCCPICIAQAALALPERSDAPPTEAESEAFRRGIEQGMFTMANAQKLVADPVAEPSDRERAGLWIAENSGEEREICACGDCEEKVITSLAAEFAAVRALGKADHPRVKGAQAMMQPVVET